MLGSLIVCLLVSCGQSMSKFGRWCPNELAVIFFSVDPVG
jgi:hypothetical protein